MASDLVGSKRVCEELDIDRATLSRWIQRGIAKPAMRLEGDNGAFLFPPEEIQRLRELRGGRKQMPQGLGEVSA